jgi:hypothetical protein
MTGQAVGQLIRGVIPVYERAINANAKALAQLVIDENPGNGYKIGDVTEKFGKALTTLAETREAPAAPRTNPAPKNAPALAEHTFEGAVVYHYGSRDDRDPSTQIRGWDTQAPFLEVKAREVKIIGLSLTTRNRQGGTEAQPIVDAFLTGDKLALAKLDNETLILGDLAWYTGSMLAWGDLCDALSGILSEEEIWMLNARDDSSRYKGAVEFAPGAFLRWNARYRDTLLAAAKTYFSGRGRQKPPQPWEADWKICDPTGPEVSGAPIITGIEIEIPGKPIPARESNRLNELNWLLGHSCSVIQDVGIRHYLDDEFKRRLRIQKTIVKQETTEAQKAWQQADWFRAEWLSRNAGLPPEEQENLLEAWAKFQNAEATCGAA